MPFSSHWLSTLERALDLLHRGHYDEALLAFDEVAREQGPEYQLFASRKEVLTRLKALELSSEGRGDLEEHVKQVRREEAMGKEVLPEGITLESMHLFHLIHQFPDNLRQLIISKDPQTYYHSQLEKADSLITVERAARRNHIDSLPSELLARIAKFVLDASEDDTSYRVGPLRERAPYTLAAVCSRWRKVIHSSPVLWGAFDLTGEHGEAHLNRALEKGVLRRIWVEEREVYPEENEEKRGQAVAFRLLKGHLGRTEELNIPLDATSNLDQFWKLWTQPGFSLKILKLRYLEPWADGDLLNNDAASDVDDLELNYRPFPTPPPLYLNLSTLTHLNLEGFNFHLGSSILPLLDRLPSLQHLSLDPCSVDFALPDATPSNPTLIHLPNLLTLSVRGSHHEPSLRNPTSIVFLCPKLEVLRQHMKASSSILFLFPPPSSTYPPNTTYLHTLDISFNNTQSPSDEKILIDHLVQLSSLKELRISHHSITDLTLLRLVWPDGEETGGGCCPLLTKLDVSNQLPGYTSDALVRMVKSRKEGRGCCEIGELMVRNGMGWPGEGKDLRKVEEVLRGMVGKLVTGW